MSRGSRLLGRVLQAPGADALIGWLERVGPWPAHRVVVLTYHRVDEPGVDGRDDRLISATPAQFEVQMAHLARGYAPVSIDDVLAARDGGRPLPARAVLVTFDDGCEDFEHHAWPVLARHGVPATVFVPTAFVGRPDRWFWWDAVHAAVTRTGAPVLPWSATDGGTQPAGGLPVATPAEQQATLRALRVKLKRTPWSQVEPAVTELCIRAGVEPPPARVMGWDTLRRLRRAGVAVCAHTRSHAHLDRLPLERARAEIGASLQDLAHGLGAPPPPVFAYPGGQWSADVRALLPGLGVRLAFTTQRGDHDLAAGDPLAIGRINVSRSTGTNALRLQLAPRARRARPAMPTPAGAGTAAREVSR